MAPVDPTLPPPHEARGACASCHDIIVPTPEPTSTPEPVVTMSPSVTITGAGTHTLEYWAQDLARNTTAHVTKTFVITPEVVPVVPVATTLTMNVSPTRPSLGHSAHFFGVMAPNMPIGTPVALLVRKAGQTKWARVGSYVRTYGVHLWSRYYHPNTRGTYYFKVQFAATATHLGSTSRTLTVIWK